MGMIRKQEIHEEILQSSATADGVGKSALTGNFAGPCMVEIANSGTAAATITLEGSWDNVTWYAVGFQKMDATAAPVRTVTAIVAATGTHHIYQVLDWYRFTRANQSSTQAGANVTVTLRTVAIT